jgi:hypothetical protein
MTCSRGTSQTTRFARGPVKTARSWEWSVAAEAIQKIEAMSSERGPQWSYL